LVERENSFSVVVVVVYVCLFCQKSKWIKSLLFYSSCKVLCQYLMKFFF
jgi:hypothetical protein